MANKVELKGQVYRRDIDGLRAIAVTTVILYHAGVSGFGGGFIGVDVFFVISGYLITQVLSSQAAGRTRERLAIFYLRRARRILPALVLVLSVSALVASILLLPEDLIRFGKYLAAATAFLGNIAPWTDGGYFEVGAQSVGLTHLWSIGVEEQFYLAYPLLLIGLDKFLPRYRFAALSFLATASFLICVWSSHYHVMANYYWAPTRAWELLLGALVASRGAIRIASRLANEAIALISVLAILATAVLFNSMIPYPGVATLLPCIATAALIAVGRQQTTFVGTVLSLRPLVLIGLISYSLYLWHLPLLAYFAYYNIKALNALQLAVVFAAMFAIAYWSWKFVEVPIRRRIALASNGRFVRVAVAACGALMIIGIVLWKSTGFPQRMPSDVQAIVRVGMETHRDMRRCNSLPSAAVESGDLCRYGSDNGDSPRVVVWGDSHAGALLPAFEAFADVHHLQLYMASWPSCRPLFDDSTGNAWPQSKYCKAFNRSMLEAIRKLDPRLIVLTARWGDLDSVATPANSWQMQTQVSDYVERVEYTLQQIGVERRVCVVLDVPILKAKLVYSLAMARRRGVDETFPGVTRSEAFDRNRVVDSAFHTLEQHGRIVTVDAKEWLCRDTDCLFRLGDKPLYSDAEHLSVTGAGFVAEMMNPCLGGGLIKRSEAAVP